jgi:Dolichyl-phosphate-mannose-protein mannosyltransferase
MNYLLFGLSLTLAILAGRHSSPRLSQSEGAGLWITILVGLLSFGVTAQLTSFASLLRPWAVLLVQAGLLVGLWCGWKVPSAVTTRMEMFRPLRNSVPCWVLLLLLGAFMILNVTHVALAPILHGDEVNYNASRPAYWIQDDSLLPRLTHNYRQYLFHSGGEYLFLWPLLFTRHERIGRVFFWLCVPLTLAGVYLLARKLGASRVFALSGTVLLAFAPQFHAHSIVRKPDLWTAFFLCGASWFLADAWQEEKRRTSSSPAIAAAFIGLASSTRVLYSPLILFPVAIALIGQPEARRRRLLAVAGGFLVAALAFGYFSPFVFSWREFGHPIGPASFRQEYGHPWDWPTVRTYLTRVGMELLEPPQLPVPRARLWLQDTGRGVMKTLATDHNLKGERDAGAWPGTYVFRVTHPPSRYALGGLLGLMSLLLIPASYVVRGFRHCTWKMKSWELIAAFGALALIAATLSIRWQSHSEIPLRLMVSPMAVILSAGAAWATQLLRQRLVWSALLLFLILYNAMPILRWSCVIAVARLREPGPALKELEGPFHPALRHLAEGSRILYVGGVNSADYPLFGASFGYSRVVIPWGPHAFDERRLTTVLESERPSHVLIENRNAVHIGVAPDINTEAMGAWLATQPGWEEVPLTDSEVRLFRRRTRL